MSSFMRQLGYLIKVGGPMKLYYAWKKCQGLVPFEAHFMITSKCNLRCTMCSIWKTPPEKSRCDLSTTEVKDLFQQLRELGTYSITLTGGEPCLREDLLELVKEAKEKGMQVQIVTNGTLLTEKLVRDLIGCGLDGIWVSIDFPSSELHDEMRGVRGTWEKAVQGVKLMNSLKNILRTKRPRIGINCVVTNLNYKVIDKILDLQPQWGYKAIRFITYTGIERLSLTREQTEEFSRKYLPIIRTKLSHYGLSLDTLPHLLLLCKQRGKLSAGEIVLPLKVMCFIPWFFAIIGAWGDVYPCCHAATAPEPSEAEGGLVAQSRKEPNMGNVRSKKFKEIWNGKEFMDFRRKCKLNPSFYRCKSCNFTPFNLFFTKLFTDPSFFLKFTGRKIFNPGYTYRKMLIDYLARRRKCDFILRMREKL